MSAALPKLRGDLHISPQLAGGGTTAVVKDPISRRFFRLGEIECFIALQLDGATSLESLQDRVERRIGQRPDLETLQQFVADFLRLGLLEGAEPRPAERRRGRIGGNPLYLRLKAFDPDRLLDWLAPRLGVVFTPGFVIGSAALTAIAFLLTLSSWAEITRDIGRLYRFDALFLAWLTVVVVTTAHEFAHGVTCKRFGGHVNEMGVLLLYFQPAFYCNISDAWLIPEKSRRLWVTFAGAYFEIVVWALATVTWRITETDTWLNFLALVVMATSGIKTLFNLNPLIKLDGYYLLSDWLEIPNLRQKSFVYLKSVFARIRGTAGQTLSIADRRARVYVAYGVLAAIYSYWLLAMVAIRFENFLVSRYQGVGFLTFTGLVLVVFQSPVANTVAKAKARFRLPPPLDSWPKRRLQLLAAVVGIVLVTVVPAELKVSGDFRILPGHNADVRTQVDGIIAEIYRNEGDAVAEGDRIARLAGRDYEAELQRLDAQIEEKKARMAMLRAGARPEEIALTRSQVEAAKIRRANVEKMFDDAGKFRVAEIAKMQTAIDKAEQRLVFAQNQLERVKKLASSSLVPRRSVEEAEEDVTVRQKELEEAQAASKMVLSNDVSAAQKERDISRQEVDQAEGRLRILLAGTRPEEIRATEAELTRLTAERDYFQQQLQLVEITSPAAGVVATPLLKEKVGQRVSRGDLIAKVLEQSTVSAEIMVSEKEIADVHVGQTVMLKARAYPGESFSSKVTAVAPVAMEETSGLGGRAVRVLAEIDNRSGLLKAEMTGNAKIYCGSRRIIDLATRRFARYIRVEFWSWW
jgi:putative peptide zinc metalloprotease protein